MKKRLRKRKSDNEPKQETKTEIDYTDSIGELIGSINTISEKVESVSNESISRQTKDAKYYATRLFRMEVIHALIAIALTVTTVRQCSILNSQNALLETQNEKIDIQSSLAESERRGSLVFLLSNVLDKIDSELKEDIGKKGINDLSPQLIGRIAALSAQLVPYYRLHNNGALEDNPKSPERGHLLLSLVNSNIDKRTLLEIYKKSNFQFSELSSTYIKNACFEGVNLSKSNLSGCTFENCEFSHASFTNCDLNNSNFVYYDSLIINTEASFVYANLNGCKFINGCYIDCSFNSASLHGARFIRTNISHKYIYYPLGKHSPDPKLASLDEAEVDSSFLERNNEYENFYLLDTNIKTYSVHPFIDEMTHPVNKNKKYKDRLSFIDSMSNGTLYNLE